MVDSEYTSDNYKSLKLGIGEVIKRLKMLRFVPDQLQAKRLFKNDVTKLSAKLTVVDKVIDTRLKKCG